MRTPVIVSAVRTPSGKFLGALKTLQAPQLGAVGRARGGRSRRRRSGGRRRMHHGQRAVGRPRPGAGAAGGAPRRPEQRGRRAHHQQGVRIGIEGGDAGGARHCARRHRRRGGRRHGVDEQRAVSPLPRARRPAHGRCQPCRLHDSRRPVVRIRALPHGNVRRARRRDLRRVARGAGFLRGRESSEGGARGGGGAVSRPKSCRSKCRSRKAPLS